MSTSAPVFHLAIVDRAGTVRLVWPTVAQAHADLADRLAEAIHPSGLGAERKRARTAATIRAHILALQEATVPLAAEEVGEPSTPTLEPAAPISPSDA